MKRFFRLSAALAALALLSGCASLLHPRQVEDLQLIQTIGFDGGIGDMTVSVSSGEASEDAVSAQLAARGASIQTAVQRLQDFSPREELFFAHIRYAAVGEDCARGGITPILDYFERGMQTQLSVPLFVVKGDSAYTLIAANGGENEITAGDQGIVYGYACRETPQLLPLPVVLAHRITMGLTEVRRNHLLEWLKPDGKAQVSVEYADGKPMRVATVVISTQHKPEVSQKELREAVYQLILVPALGKYLDQNTGVLINPSGSFVLGGFEADTGLTGRKLMVDTYGGIVSHGGGALSGKDCTKVDRSGAYMARYLAKNIVAARLAEECTVSLAYAIGVAQPVSILVETFGTGTVADEVLEKAVRKTFDLRPTAIIRDLGLQKPIYRQLAAYGHMGREDLGVLWEKTDRAEQLKAACQ